MHRYVFSTIHIYICKTAFKKKTGSKNTHPIKYSCNISQTKKKHRLVNIHHIAGPIGVIREGISEKKTKCIPHQQSLSRVVVVVVGIIQIDL